MSSSILDLFGKSDGTLQMKMDFDDCDMDAASIFFNSPERKFASESMTSGYQSFEADTSVLSEEQDVDMELEECRNTLTVEQFQLSKPIGLRRSLSLDMRRKMMENDTSSSPSCFARPRKVKLVRKDEKIEEDIHEIREEDRIKSAVDRLSDSRELIADCSRPYSLPTVCGKHKDMKSISPQTMRALINGKYPLLLNNYMILDCRYPYEYNGGHIQGAVNTYIKDSIDLLLKREECDRPNIIIFHCEFSSQRAPTLLRHLRSQDRLINSNNYPSLYYPEVYILDGGYKVFFEQKEGLCYPQAYTPMLHEDHSSELRHFRVKSKSWAAGEKPKQRNLNRPRTIRF